MQQRRRYRAHSATIDTQSRFNPALLLLVLALGVMAGFVCTSPGQLFGSSNSPEEQYLVLTATLHGQGESAAAIKQRLISLGYKNPATTVLTLAEKLQASEDPQKQQQGEALRQLSDALTVAGDVAPPAPTAVSEAAPPAATTVASPTAATAPSSPPLTPVVDSPSTKETGNPPPQPGATPTTPPASQQTPDASGAANPGNGGLGTIKTTGNDPAMLRAGPNTEGTPRAVIPNGEKVQILKLVTGEAVDGVENRWYQVKYGQFEGYIYFKLVIPGD